MYHRVKPNKELINYIADNMRPMDAEEVYLSDDHTPRQALMKGLELSSHSAIVMFSDTPLAMFGVVQTCTVTGCGSPWLLASKDILKHKKELVRLSPDAVNAMLCVYPRLVNYVYKENKLSVRWLKWLGFSMDDPKPYGVHGEDFHRFYMEKH